MTIIVKMHIIDTIETITATQLKRDTANVINKVIYTGQDVTIERYGVVVARITPASRPEGDSASNLLKKYRGSIPGLNKQVRSVRKTLAADLDQRLK